MEKITSDDQALSLLPQKDISVWEQYGDSYNIFNKYNYVLRYLTVYKVTHAELVEVQNKADQNNDAINFINSTNAIRDKKIKGLDQGIEENDQKIAKNIKDIGNLKKNAIDKNDLSDINKKLGTQETQISNKADKDSVTDIKNQVNGFSSQITGKVDKTTYDTDMSSIDSKITGVKNNIKDITPTVQKEIENNLKGHVLDISAGTVPDNDDLDNYDQEGMYQILNAQNILNAPTTRYNWCKLLVFKYGGNGVYQIFFSQNNSWIRALSGVPTTWGDWSSFAGENMVDTTSNQIVNGQKQFAQNPETVNGDTIYPASTTGWIHNTGLTPGKNIEDLQCDYRVDTINHNPTFYISGSFKANGNWGKDAWGGDGNVVFTFPNPYVPRFVRFATNYQGDAVQSPVVLRTYQSILMADNINATGTFDPNNRIEFWCNIPCQTIFS